VSIEGKNSLKKGGRKRGKPGKPSPEEQAPSNGMWGFGEGGFAKQFDLDRC